MSKIEEIAQKLKAIVEDEIIDGIHWLTTDGGDSFNPALGDLLDALQLDYDNPMLNLVRNFARIGLFDLMCHIEDERQEEKTHKKRKDK